MHLLGLGLIVAFAALQLQGESRQAPAPAIQNPQDVTFVITPKASKSTFRVGEEIVLEFRLSSPSPRRYVVDQLYRGNHRTVRPGSPFVVEPTSGTVDPWLDVPWLFDGYGGGVMGTEPRFLNATPVVSEATLNEWISFRTPGRYRVTATTRQISIPVQSNTIEIEIVAPEPGWAEARLQEAVAILNSGQAKPNLQAARTLRFLNTESAAARLVEFFTKLHSEVYVGQQLEYGMYGSPYRKEVLAAMEAVLESPDVPIAQGWMDAMVGLASVTAAGPRLLPPVRVYDEDPSSPRFKAAMEAQAKYQSDEARYTAHFSQVGRLYYEKLAAAAERKQGQARTVTLQTLASRRR
jgi:hypothetical protein